MEKKKVLGRGMASLISDPSLLPEGTPLKDYFFCDIENIEPSKTQPRKLFNAESLKELAISIKEKGILQPILVRKLSDFRYEIIAGERRWRAAQRAGLKQIPVIIRKSSDSDLFEEALIENIQREDLNDIEEAIAYKKLLDLHQYTQEKLANKLGKQRATISNKMRLLDLPQGVQDLLITGKLSAGHARALISINDEAQIVAIAKQAVDQNLTVRECEALVKNQGWVKGRTPSAPKKNAYIELLEQELSQHFKAKVRIQSKGEKKGRIELEFFGENELNRIVALLKA